MADAHASADALLTEHFRYTPLSLIDDIINTINTIVYRAINALETGLLGTPAATLGFASDAEKRLEIEDGVHRLETLLEATVDRNFDKLEIYALRNILTVEEGLLPWVRLAHYKDLHLPLSSNTPTPASIQTIRDEINASESLNLALEVEAAATQNLLTQLQSLLARPGTGAGTSGALAFLLSKQTGIKKSSNATNSAEGPLTEDAAFASSQLPSLRALLATLRPALARLPQAASAGIAASSEQRERIERREYVNGEAERAVKGAVGVVSDEGESSRLGGDITEADVMGLEAVMAERRRDQNDADMAG